MALLEQVSQGSTTALATLIGFAQQAANLPDDLGNAYTTSWSNLSKEQVAFFDKMAEANLGYWSEVDGETERFVWATSDMLSSVVEEAGTAVEAWENPYTWLYNYNEEINRVIKEREKSERAFTRALEDEESTAGELLTLSIQQLKTLEEEA
jgi:preprotein translocase subunit SecE